MIVVTDLHKKFGNLHVLKGITNRVKTQEVVCVIGPSGSGKVLFEMLKSTGSTHLW